MAPTPQRTSQPVKSEHVPAAATPGKQEHSCRCAVDIAQRIGVDQAPTKVDPDDNITAVQDLGPPVKQRAECQADSARCQPSCASVTY